MDVTFTTKVFQCLYCSGGNGIFAREKASWSALRQHLSKKHPEEFRQEAKDAKEKAEQRGKRKSGKGQTVSNVALNLWLTLQNLD